MSNNSAVVRALFDAFVRRDRNETDSLLAPDFTFTSPYDDAIDRNAFFLRCWPNGDRFADFRIERVSPDAAGAFVTYFVTTKGDASFRNTEYLTVAGGLVTSTNVYFGASYREGKFEAKQQE